MGSTNYRLSYGGDEAETTLLFTKDIGVMTNT